MEVIVKELSNHLLYSIAYPFMGKEVSIRTRELINIPSGHRSARYRTVSYGNEAG